MLSPALPRLRAQATGRAARTVVLLAALTTLAALAFVFAPVRQPEVTYTWTSADGPAVALPLMPYQPVTLAASVPCAPARTAGLLLSTTPPRPDPAAAPLAGLTLAATPAGVVVTSAGTPLGTVAPPPGPCSLTLASDATATTVSVDGTPVLRHAGDVRPDVAGVFTDAPADAGLTLTLTTDTRFTTTPTPVKLALGAVCLLALAALAVVLARADRRWPARRVRLLPAGWWRPRPVDGAVTALLVVWWVVGAGTVDDGYITGIVRGRGENGVVGNVYRWLNAPEAPFGWFYETYHWWSLVSPATPWMRLPSTLLGLLCWALVSRLLLPRLGDAGRRPATAWVAALAFGTWWVPLNLGLRPEPWVAVGVVLAFLAVERALATGRVLPLATALLVAGVTTAVTPAGLMAVAPVLAAAAPLLRLLRARTDLQLGGRARPLPLLAVVVAAPAAALLLMAADQGAAGLVEAVRVRGLIGGGQPWAEESVRYALLVTPGAIQGAIGRRAAVLGTLLAAAGLLWTLGRRPRLGIAPGPTRRLLATLALCAVEMTFTPTKWTQHFGDLAGLGTAVLALGLVAFGRRTQRGVAAHDPDAAHRRWRAGLAGVTAVGALVLAGRNQWPFVSGWYRPTFSTLPPQVPVGGTDVPVASVVLAAGGLMVAVGAARAAWRRSAAPVPDERHSRRHLSDGSAARRWWGPGHHGRPAPAALMGAVLVAVLVLQVGSLVRIAAAHPAGYTPTTDAVATAAGDPCGLQSALLVETDPAAGALAPVPGPVAAPARPATLDVGGTALPAVAVTDAGTTPWYVLDPRQRSGTLPVVVTVGGWTRPAPELAVEFARGREVLAHVPLAGSALPADRRLLAPPDADVVRLAVAPGPAATGDTPLASLPRAPVLTPMDRVLPRGTRAVLDWPVAFVFPCLTPAALTLGTAELPRWRVGPPADDDAADITYTPGLGGPFAAPRLLITQHRMPTYVRDDPTLDGPQLYRWDPVAPFRTSTPSVRVVDVVVAPAGVTPLRVPRLVPEDG